MSAVEVVGVALAVLPIIISAIESYNDIGRRFQRFRKLSAEIKEFQSLLKIERTKFRLECRLLFAQFVGEDKACDMLNDLSHPAWEDEDLECQLTRYLHDSKEACIENTRLIEGKLRELEETSTELDKVVNRAGKKLDGSFSKRIRDKLKFIFSESNLDCRLARLRELNESFHRLTDQLSRTESLRSSGSGSVPRERRRNIEKFQQVRSISSDLYNALGNACTKHTEHAAHICLRPSISDLSNDEVHFSVSFSPFVSATFNGTLAYRDPIWFAIESIAIQSPQITSGAPERLSEINSGIKRPGFSFPQSSHEKNKKKRKVVQLDRTSPPRILSVNGPLPYLKPNFCSQLKSCARNCHDQKVCLGALEESTKFRHLVYLSSTSPADLSKLSVSLERLFTSLSKSKDSDTIIPMYEKVRFSKLLATAVLQFCATPWLRESWRSQDVLLFYADSVSFNESFDQSDDNHCSLNSPYINVPIRGPSSPLTPSTTFPSRVFAPNPLLFGLGVMLLELAYEKPLRSMQQPCDLLEGQGDRHAEFFTAKRLSNLVSTKVGRRYREVVRKCLWCDFGRGHDLDRLELQEGFYKDVISELETIEASFRNLQLGD